MKEENNMNLVEIESNIVYNSLIGNVMKTANLTVKLNENVKKEFQKFCDSVGLNPSVAINMFISNVIHHQELPFSVRSPYKETLEALEESEYMLKHLDEYKSYNSAEDLFDDIGR